MYTCFLLIKSNWELKGKQELHEIQGNNVYNIDRIWGKEMNTENKHHVKQILVAKKEMKSNI